MPENTRSGHSTFVWNNFFLTTEFIQCANPLIVDIEAVNFANSSEMVDLAILDYSGQVLFNEQIRPSNPVDRWSYRVHGYNDEFLKTKKRFKYHYKQIHDILNGRVIVSYNGQSDLRFFYASARKNFMIMPNLGWLCLANSVKQIIGSKNQISLNKACQIFGVDEEPKPHRALEGAKTCLNLIHKVEEQYVRSKNRTN